MFVSQFKKYLLIASVAALPLQVFASGWTLDQQNSSISFVSVKKENIAEAHTFTDFSGVISGSTASVTIKADSVDTIVPIRNERIREFLFETGVYPEISISANVKDLQSIAVDKPAKMSVPATLSLHGVEKEVALDVFVNKSSDGSVIVTSAKPVLVRAADYNLDGGIGKLSEVMGGISITKAVPVMFALVFNKG